MVEFSLLLSLLNLQVVHAIRLHILVMLFLLHFELQILVINCGVQFAKLDRLHLIPIALEYECLVFVENILGLQFLHFQLLVNFDDQHFTFFLNGHDLRQSARQHSHDGHFGGRNALLQ